MDIVEFNYLGETERILTTWAKGVSLAERTHPDGKRKVLLFQLDSFYVEMDFDPTENMVEEIRSFYDMEYLNPYTDSIDISGF